MNLNNTRNLFYGLSHGNILQIMKHILGDKRYNSILNSSLKNSVKISVTSDGNNDQLVINLPLNNIENSQFIKITNEGFVSFENFSGVLFPFNNPLSVYKILVENFKL